MEKADSAGLRHQLEEKVRFLEAEGQLLRESEERTRQESEAAKEATVAGYERSLAPLKSALRGAKTELGALGQRWLAPAEDSDEAADDAWQAHRLAMGVPEGSAELGDILWLETNAVELHGVSFAKGCYIGQENTARMNWRSKVNRRLVVVPLDQSDEKRRKAEYPAHGLAVDHLRVADIDPALAPEWMRPGLTPAEE